MRGVVVSRNKPQGIAHREKLRQYLLPKLKPGVCLPRQVWLGWFLGIDKAEGGRQLRRVLAEEGIKTVIKANGIGRRSYVAPSPISPISPQYSSRKSGKGGVYGSSNQRNEVRL
jgi:hypothetical protein